MESFNKNISDKFSGLLYVLKKSKKEFELIADEIGNSSLRTALNGLSADSNYYAGEIKQYLINFGFEPQIPNEYVTAEALAESEEVSGAPGTELQNICSHNERSLIKAYTDLITESMPYQNLREVMTFQLEALKFAFMKVKTLNRARFMTYQPA